MSDNTNNNRRKYSADKEAILVALDQLSQTMAVMSQVVARLKRSVEQANISEHHQASVAQASVDAVKQYYQRRQQAFDQSAQEKQTESVPASSIVIH